jgi:hypothetical protein
VVNEHIRTTGLHIIYDDIKSKENVDGEYYFGAKTQLKQVLGVGLLYQFKKVCISQTDFYLKLVQNDFFNKIQRIS